MSRSKRPATGHAVVARPSDSGPRKHPPAPHRDRFLRRRHLLQWRRHPPRARREAPRPHPSFANPSWSSTTSRRCFSSAPALALGNEDLNDHDELRRDPALQAVAGRMTSRRRDCAPRAGRTTLSRLELAAAGLDHARARKIIADFRKMDELLVALCVESFEEEPEEVVLDLDATDIPLHGKQEGRFFHSHYRCYCYMPLLFLVGEQPVMVRARLAQTDPHLTSRSRGRLQGARERCARRRERRVHQRPAGRRDRNPRRCRTTRSPTFEHSPLPFSRRGRSRPLSRDPVPSRRSMRSPG